MELKTKLSGPENEYVENALRTKGLVLYGVGLYDEAEEAFKKALHLAIKLNITESQAGRYRDLARCYAQSGKIAAAKENYEKSIAK